MVRVIRIQQHALSNHFQSTCYILLYFISTLTLSFLRFVFSVWGTTEEKTKRREFSVHDTKKIYKRYKQYRQRTYNVTLWSFRVTILQWTQQCILYVFMLLLLI